MVSNVLVCLGLAGTAVSDSGVVMSDFADAMTSVSSTADWAQRMRAADQALEVLAVDLTAARRAVEISGAADALARLRAHGIKVCLTTRFSSATRDLVIDTLRWPGVADLTLSSADADRDYAWSDVIWTSVLRMRTGTMSGAIIVGDTVTAVGCGRRAGAGLVIGALTGTSSEADLIGAGADEIINDITDLAALVDVESSAAFEENRPVYA